MKPKMGNGRPSQPPVDVKRPASARRRTPRPRRILALIFAALFSGCAGDQANRLSLGPEGVAVSGSPQEVVVDLSGLKKDLQLLRSESNASRTAVQNSISGVGANLGKISDKVTGVEAAISAQAEVNAALKAKLDAMATLQAGMRNSVERSSQEIAATRDANVKNIQFTKEMQQSLEAAYSANTYVVYVCAGAIVTVVGYFLEASRKRAEIRAKQALDLAKAQESKGKPNEPA